MKKKEKLYHSGWFFFFFFFFFLIFFGKQMENKELNDARPAVSNWITGHEEGKILETRKWRANK